MAAGGPLLWRANRAAAAAATDDDDGRDESEWLLCFGRLVSETRTTTRFAPADAQLRARLAPLDGSLLQRAEKAHKAKRSEERRRDETGAQTERLDGWPAAMN